MRDQEPTVDWGSGGDDATGRISAEYELPLAACLELERAAAERMSPWSGRDQHADASQAAADELISLELARSTKTFRAVTTLCRAGYGEQGAMLNRSLFEGMAVAHWVHKNPSEAAERFEQGKRMDAHLAAKLIQELDWAHGVDEEILKEAQLTGEELEAFEKAFGEHGDRLWIGPKSLPKLLRAIEMQWGEEGRKTLWDFYRVVNRDNNQLLHSTVLGLRRAYSGPDGSGGNVWVGPSNVHIGEALFGTFWTYAQVLSLASERFEFPAPEKLDQLFGDLQFNFVELRGADVRDVGRNEQCPCKSGSKYKVCHQGQMDARGRP